jgi:hypothetical protein
VKYSLDEPSTTSSEEPENERVIWPLETLDERAVPAAMFADICAVEELMEIPSPAWITLPISAAVIGLSICV